MPLSFTLHIKSVAKPSKLYLQHIFPISTSPCVPLPPASTVLLASSLTDLLAPTSLSYLLAFLNHVYFSFLLIHTEKSAISARNPSGILHFRFLTFQAGFLLSPTPTPHSNLISCCTHTYFTFLPPDLLAIPRIPCIFFVDLSADSPLYPIHLCLCSPPDYSGTRSSANCSNMFSSSPIQLCIATLALLTIC